MRELEDRIVELLESGLSLTAVCKRIGMPSRSVVQAWCNENPAFAARLLQARDRRHTAHDAQRGKRSRQ